DETKRVEHRRLVGNRRSVERGRPVEDFHGGRNRHQEAEHRENQTGVNGLAGYEHVEAPNDEDDHRDRNARDREEGVTEYPLTGEGGDEFADNAHAGQNHDVNSGMRIEPEHVLEKQWIAAERRIENPGVEDALNAQQENRDGDHGRAEDEDEAGRIERPNEERQAEPRHARGTHLVDRDDEVQTG